MNAVIEALETPTQRAFRLIGGAAAVARLCKVSPQAAHKWLKRGAVPPEHVRTVESGTEAHVDGPVTRYELRPDIFGERAA